jgi:hypothetical protein
MEGGAYPSDGAEAMAMELAHTIQSNGGGILIRALVEEIVYDPSGDRLLGVRARRSLPNAHPSNFQGLVKKLSEREESVFIPCKRVVSGAGYAATFDRLVPERVLSKYGVPRRLEVGQSAGFVMANVGEWQRRRSSPVSLIFPPLCPSSVRLSRHRPRVPWRPQSEHVAHPCRLLWRSLRAHEEIFL